MPMYEYRCRDCGRRFEVLQRMGAGAEGVECPACGAENAEKLLSTFAASIAASSGPSCAGPTSSGGCGGGGGFT